MIFKTAHFRKNIITLTDNKTRLNDDKQHEQTCYFLKSSLYVD